MMMSRNSPRFDVALAPNLDEATIREHLQVHYRRTPTNLTPLPGERDQNFKCSLPLDRGEVHTYVFKISHPDEEADFLECQQQVLERLSLAFSTAHTRVARFVPDRNGRSVGRIEDSAGTGYLTRLLTWVSGIPLAQYPNHSTSLLTAIGDFLGRLSEALQGYDHPAAHRRFAWDLEQAQEVIPETLSAVPSSARQSLERIWGRFRDLPCVPANRHSVIHGDANDFNLLVDEHSQELGLIDTGDVVYSATINELAIALAYVMMNKPSPMPVANRVVAAYHKRFPLLPEEVDSLFARICLRLVTSVCMAAAQRANQPDNAYLSISEAAAWKLLKQLEQIPAEIATIGFRLACGWEGHSGAAHYDGWLRRNVSAPIPILEGVPTESYSLLDLSVGGEDLFDYFEHQDVSQLETSLLRRSHLDGCQYGLGKYDEPRIWYQGEDYQANLDDPRTIHLGIDLFTHAGTGVLAPFSGRVHSFADNDSALNYGPTLILEHELADCRFHTLYGHLSRESMQLWRPGQTVTAGERIGWLGASSENGGWPAHLHFQVMLDMLDYQGDYPGVVSAGLREAWKVLCPDPGRLLGLEDSARWQPPNDSLKQQRRQKLGPSYSLSYREPLKIVRGWKQYLYSEMGHRYLDGVNNVCHVGHCHPTVVRAAQRQLQILNTNTRYLHDHLVNYATRLTDTFPAPLDVCFLVNSGSEANDLALRLARCHTQRHGIAVIDSAYHGHLTSLIDISPYKHNGPGGAGCPAHVVTLPLPDTFRGQHRDLDNAGGQYLREAIEAMERARQHGNALGALIAESILSCGGQIVLPPGYLRELYAYCREVGALCIADEVQVGFGRVGSHFWAFETQGVVPDIVTLGKPIGNGHPLAAVITTREIADSFANGMEYFNTFGGNPVSCAVGLAVLDVIEREQLQRHAHELGSHFLDRLRRLRDSFPVVGDVRGMGLFLGIELIKPNQDREPNPQLARHLVESMKEAGFLLSTDGPRHNVIKIKPPLCIQAEDVNALVDAMHGYFVRWADAFH